MGKYVIGYDLGTGGLRAGIYDFTGKEIAFAQTEYETFYRHSGWAEQKPEDWWNAFAESTKEAVRRAGIDREEIIALSYDVTCCSVMLCRKDGTPLRDCVMWMDVRASKEAEDIRNTHDDALKFNGYGNVSAEWMPCKALWLKRNERNLYDRADVVCECADWITYRLTGKWTANLSETAIRWYYDSQNGGFQKSLYEKIGLADVLEKFPQEMHMIGDSLGTISPEAAEFLGLSEHTLVAQGGTDAYIGILGLGAVDAGKVALITGFRI